MNKKVLIATGSLLLISGIALSQSAQAGTYNVFMDDGDIGTSADTAGGSVVWETHYEAADKIGSSFRLSYMGYGSSNYYYRWNKDTGNSTSIKYQLSAYLGSYLYTNTAARYYLSGTWAGTINQDTAPAGNNWVGAANDYGVIQVQVSSYGVGRTGADQVNLWY